MLPILNSCGLPICLSGISHPLALYKEMADHDRRREAMKKMKFQENMHVHEMIRTQNRKALGNGGGSDGGDVTNVNGTVIIHDYSCISLACTAKAA